MKYVIADESGDEVSIEADGDSVVVNVPSGVSTFSFNAKQVSDLGFALNRAKGEVMDK